jgi:uncharacterized protein (TIGR00251 family)
MKKGIPSWIREENDCVLLFLHAQPGAKREGIVGVYADKLKIALATPPVDGKANKALTAFLSKKLSTPKKNIEILSGEFSREKKVKINSVSFEEVLTELASGLADD